MVETLILREPQAQQEPDIEWSSADLEQSLAVCVSVRQQLQALNAPRFSSRLQILSLQKEEAWLHKKIAEARLWETETEQNRR